jgi:di/tricarboxylate transporter
LGATVGAVGSISGFINNTAAVAILMPMVTDLAHEGKTSPSKLLLPLSYASMFGGTLTLIGTSTNILASDLSARLATEHPELHAFSMFEFTALGILVSVVGAAYLMTLGRWLTPARIPPREDLTEEFELQDYLTEVVVTPDSPLVGRTVAAALDETEFDVDLVQLIRGGRTFVEPLGPTQIQSGDVFALRTDRETLVSLLDTEGLELLPEAEVTDEELEGGDDAERSLVEVVVAPRSSLVGETLASTNFRDRYDATVLALRRGPEYIRKRMEDAELQVGDILLVQATADSISRLNVNRDFIVAQEIERPDYRESKILLAVGIVAAVVAAEAAAQLGANAFAFVLAVTFAASTAFMTPVGYQTNLFVYGPGGYKFTDYVRVGGPLQLLFAVVTTAGIAAI